MSGEEIAPTVCGYLKWFENEVKDHTYIFLFDVCWTFLLAFVLYNESVRKNNHSNMMAARTARCPLLYGRHHPKYQEIHLRDMCDRACYPSKLHDHMKQTESFTVTGENNKGQGADFIHEELNRTIKSFLPPGPVSKDTWKQVCRNADHLQEIQSRVFSMSGMRQTASKKKI